MKKRNRVAIFNILSTVLINGISIITGPLFSRLLGDSGYGFAFSSEDLSIGFHYTF